MLMNNGSFKGTTRVKFSNTDNLWKPHDNNVCIDYRQPITVSCGSSAG